MTVSSDMSGKISAESRVHETQDTNASGNYSAPDHWFRNLRRHPATWPLLALAAILVIDWLTVPNFFAIRVVEGRLFGNVIDILYRAVPTAIVEPASRVSPPVYAGPSST